MTLGSKTIYAVLMTAGIAALGAGCGDKTAPTKENFTQVLKEDYSSTADCLFSKALPFPAEVSVNDTLLAQTRKQLDAMATVGLLSREQASKGQATVNRYTLTANGQRVAGDGRFCYGKREVTSVDKFTAPADFNGNRFTRVDYHFVEKSNAPWAKEEIMRLAFPTVAKTFAEQPVDRATLVLTPDGWVLNQ